MAEPDFLTRIKASLQPGAQASSSDEKYFADYHNNVKKSGRALIGKDGSETTMRIESVGLDGRTYLIPTYDPDTQQVLDTPRAVDRALPDIRSGKLRGYGSVEEAEKDRERFYPGIVGQATPVHTSPASPAGKSPAFLETIKMKLADSQLSPAAQAGQQMVQQSMVHKPPSMLSKASPEAQRDFGSNPRALAQMTDVPTTHPDPQTTREAMQLPGLAARVGLEAAGAAVGGGVAGPLVRRAAAPIVKKGLEVAARAVGSGAGALSAQVVDPVDDPYGNALLTMGFGGFAEGLSAAVQGARQVHNATGAGGTASTAIAALDAMSPGGARMESVPGARQTMELLGREALPSAGRLSKNRMIDTLENVVENSIAGGGSVTRRNEVATTRARKLIEGFTQRFLGGASRQDVDRLVWDITDNRMGAFKASAEKLYEKVDEVAGASVDTAAIIQARNQLVRKHQTGGKSSGMEQLVQAIDRTLGVPPELRGIEKGYMISTTPVVPRGPGVNAAFGPITDAPHGAIPTIPATPGRWVESRRLVAGNAEDIPSRPQRWVPGREAGVAEPQPTALSSISFKQAQQLRSDILSQSRDASDVFASQVEGNTKWVGKTVDDAMSAAILASDNPQAHEFWRMANQFWKDGADAFGETVMRTLANAKPDQLFQLIMTGDSPQQVARFRKLVLGATGTSEDTARRIRASAERTLRDPSAHPLTKELAQARIDNLATGEATWQKFQGQFVANLLRSSDSGAGIATLGAKGERGVDGALALSNWSRMSDEMLREVFPKQTQRRHVERLFRALETSQSGTGLSVGRIGVQMTQWSGIAGGFGLVLTGNVGLGAATGAGVLITPFVLGKLLNNTEFIEWTVRGLKAAPGSRAQQEAMGRIAVVAARAGARVMGSDGRVIDPNGTSESQRRFRQTAQAANRGR